MEFILKAVSEAGLDSNALTTLALWYIGWNLRGLKRAPDTLAKSTTALIKALDAHSKVLEYLISTRKHLDDEKPSEPKSGTDGP